MKTRPELTVYSPEVKSNSNGFYIDSQGRVNELEDDEERILFGTLANPNVKKLNNPPPFDPEEQLWKEAERDAMRAMDTELNPHLKMLNILADVFEKIKK